MINAHTSSKVKVINNLFQARILVSGIRSYICLNEKDREKIDSILDNTDSIVNRIMGVEEGK